MPDIDSISDDYEDKADELLEAAIQFQYEYRISRLNPVQLDRRHDVAAASRRMNEAIQSFIECKERRDAQVPEHDDG